MNFTKNGIPTLSRLLGKKSKSQTISKSTSNLSVKSQSQIDTSAPLSSHLEQNIITPLAATNAPFEQTFRITVLLPKGQLYVARLGAKTDLGRLLILVCENKQLDPEKYEFRHPADSSQVYSCEQTIGAVGLNEIRLCNKSEAYDNFNADEIITMRQTVGRESLSSSELSSRHSKHTLKTPSPYSSTNSLNSSDSAGMSISYRGTTTSLPPQTTTSNQQKPPVAPARKKRIAPRPPSQSSIVPNGVAPSQNGSEFKQPLGRKEFHVSSPNLSQCSEMTTLRAAEFHKSNVSVDCNGNSRTSRDNNSASDGSNGQLHCNGTPTVDTPPLPLSPALSSMMRPVSMSILNSEIHYEEKELNGNRDLIVNGSVMDLSKNNMPEPAPRKRIIAAKKKAPAPPPRGMQPVASPRVSPAVITEVTYSEENLAEYLPNKSRVNDIQPSGAITQERKLSETGLQESITVNGMKESVTHSPPSSRSAAVPKSFENGPSTERSSDTCNQRLDNQIPEAIVPTVVNSKIIPTSQPPTSDLVSKSPPLTPASPIKPNLESKLSLETSSDDDDQIKVYNLKLGKTISKPLAVYENNVETEKNLQSPKALSFQTEPTVNSISPTSPVSPVSPTRPESPEWSYTIPAPPKFADNETVVVTYQSTSNCVSPTNGSVLSDRDEILTNSSDAQNEIFITSDLEDGYRGGKEQIETKLNDKEPLNSLESERKETAPVNEQSEVIITDLSRKRNESPLSSLENTESSKPEVIRQLSNTITENGGIEKILSRRNDTKEEDKIESVKPCNLNNFKIQTYSIKPTTVEDIAPQKDKSSDPIVLDEENMYIKSAKRPSLTLSNSVAVQIRRSRSSVTRSDSFHSTLYQNSDEPNLVTSRSTSYVSLIAAQTNLNDRFLDTNRRKSSSELSIGESPSLQSLIVMKSILNSRKNSLSNGSARSETDLKSPDIVDNAKTMEIKNSPVIETMKTVYRRPSFKDFMSISEGSISPTTVTESVNTKKNNIECRNSSLIDTKIAELEKSVNATPVETKIETMTATYDCDSSKENSPKNKIISQTKINSLESAAASPPTAEPEKIYKYQGPPSINLSTWNERPKGQVAIKTDNDYKFGVGHRTSIDYSATHGQTSTEVSSAAAHAKDQPSPFKVPFVRSVEYKKATSMIETTPTTPIERAKPAEGSTTQSTINNHPRPLSVHNPVILVRSAPKITRSSFVPVVKGFKSIETPTATPHTETSSGAEHSNHEVTQRPATIIRSKSSVSTNILRLSTDNNIQRVPITFNKKDPSPPIQNAPFFSQTALRKTGIKERIIADENAEAGVPKPLTPRANNDQQQNCAKLELKLTTTVTSNQNSNFRNSIAKDIPPPPPPVIRSVVTKQNSLGKSACIPDTRDQLLSAIRNFNKTALKRN